MWIPAICLVVNSELCGKLFSSVPFMASDNLGVNPVTLECNLSSWESNKYSNILY